KCDWELLRSFVSNDNTEGQMSLEAVGIDVTQEKLLELIDIAEVMASKYEVVVTNPPYMGNGAMGSKLVIFAKENYKKTKSDLSTMFMEKNIGMLKKNGYTSLINIPVWMFIQAYKDLRIDIVNHKQIINMLHFGRGIFGSDFGTTAFIIRNDNNYDYNGMYFRLFDNQNAVDNINLKEKWFMEKKNKYITKQEFFNYIPTSPIAYWVSNSLLKNFEELDKLSEHAILASGTSTGDNDRFLRLWMEVDNKRIGVELDRNYNGIDYKWIPCNKGGVARKWYGNFEYIMDWENNGEGIKNNRDERGKLRSRPLNLDKNFIEGLTWTKVGAGSFAVRFFPNGYICESIGAALYENDYKLEMILGLLNSKVSKKIMEILNPTMGCQPGDVGRIPVCSFEEKDSMICYLVDECIKESQSEYDSFETSRNFKKHPLI
ncbi:Eco57I restriction-modification methylase domain-containing protein, partial [uncultured Eubacterium sp.]|uniref:Eco57I restriction-modification methylase domain-containing protein n=1 Tax=uncultured Eubacterium sp. TaxID=165185 RepID=UPI002594550A